MAPSGADPTESFEASRVAAELSHGELWLRYFALGGMRSAVETEAYLYGALVASTPDRDLLAVALNERFSERGGDHPVPYSDDVEPPA